jgi:hypothetical protein
MTLKNRRTSIVVSAALAFAVAAAIVGVALLGKSPDERFEDAARDWAAETQWEDTFDSIFEDDATRDTAFRFGREVCDLAKERGANTTQAASLFNDGTNDMMVLSGLAKAAESAYCPETAGNNWLN